MDVVRGHLKFHVHLFCEHDGGQECDFSVASSLEMGGNFPATFHSTVVMPATLSPHLDIAAKLRGDMDDKETVTAFRTAMRMAVG